MRKISWLVLALLVSPLFAYAEAFKPADTVPPGLAIVSYFSEGLRRRLAETLVENFIQADEDHSPGVGAIGSLIVTRHLAGDGGQRWDMTPAVKIASHYPAVVPAYYNDNIEDFIDQMVQAARQKGLTDTEIRALFLLYALKAKQQAYYLELAAQDLHPASKLDKAILDAYACYINEAEPLLNAPRCDQYSHYDKLTGALERKYGSSFKNEGLDTWLFGRRRYYDGGAKLVKAFAVVLNDASQRANRVLTDGRPHIGLPSFLDSTKPPKSAVTNQAADQ